MQTGSAVTLPLYDVVNSWIGNGIINELYLEKLDMQIIFQSSKSLSMGWRGREVVRNFKRNTKFNFFLYNASSNKKKIAARSCESPPFSSDPLHRCYVPAIFTVARMSKEVNRHNLNEGYTVVHRTMFV